MFRNQEKPCLQTSKPHDFEKSTAFFQTLRQFNNTFPSQIYLCPNCKKLTSNKYQCEFCQFQANNIANQNFTYKIEELNKIDTILIPIELKGGIIWQTKS